MYKIFDKNISEEKYVKLRNYLFKMKELILGKGLFISIKWQLSFTKGHLGDQEGKVENIPIIRSCF